MADAKLVFTQPKGLVTEVLFDREHDARCFLQQIMGREFQSVDIEFVNGIYGVAKEKFVALSVNAP